MRDQDRGKRLIAVFLLGLVLLNFPLLAVVETYPVIDLDGAAFRGRLECSHNRIPVLTLHPG